MMKSCRIGWSGHVAQVGEKMNACRLLVRKPEGKRSVGRPRRMWKYSISMDLREREREGGREGEME
jgi:hypothetical protein